MCDRAAQGNRGEYCAPSCTTTTASVASFGAIIRGEESAIRIFPASKCFQQRLLYCGRDLERWFGTHSLHRDAHLVYIVDTTGTDREMLFEPDPVSLR